MYFYYFLLKALQALTPNFRMLQQLQTDRGLNAVRNVRVEDREEKTF